jgi:hypothetical protein
VNEIQEMIDEVMAEPFKEVPPEFATNEKLLAEEVLHVRHLLLEAKVPEIMPTFTIVAGNGQIVPIVTPFVGDPENMEQIKNTIALGLRLAMRQMRAKRYSMMVEAWMASFDSEKDSGEQRAGREIRELENKIEVVQIIVCDPTGTIGTALEIIRDWETGSITELKEIMQQQSLKDEEPAKFSGRFADLLD